MDLIDRRVAIDALKKYIVDNGMYDMDENVQGFNDGISCAISELSVIPSAQPEVGTQMSLAQRWIPCSERLPDDVEIGEEYPTVIFCTAEGTVHVGGYEHYLGGKWWYMETWEDEAKGVIAWMPLPECYKGE